MEKRKPLLVGDEKERKLLRITFDVEVLQLILLTKLQKFCFVNFLLRVLKVLS